MSKAILLNRLVKKICAEEKGKKQLNAGQVREVIKVLSNLLNDIDFHETYMMYINYSEKKK